MELNQSFHADVVLVRSIPRPWGVVDISYADLAIGVLESAHASLLKEAAEISGGSPKVSFRLKVGFENPDDLILAAARDNDADLVVVGCDGRDAVETLAFGSVSRSIALNCTCPVLVLSPECASVLAHAGPVLFASDLKDTGIRAAEYARAIAERCACQLIALHSVDSTPSVASDRIWHEERAREQLRIALGYEAGADPTRYRLTSGNAAEEILAEALREHASLIVLGGGKHSVGTDHLPWETLGRVLRTSSCPVLVVPVNSK
jgi:nucleotide-binding universal stress UspA family protein